VRNCDRSVVVWVWEVIARQGAGIVGREPKKLVQLVSLITLLIVNGKATTFLQQHGIKVGFMGTNPDTI
jgi:hypothetical protein